jgi:hypothetical protein
MSELKTNFEKIKSKESNYQKAYNGLISEAEKALKFGFAYENEIGLSAQDVRRVVPEVVKIAPFDSMKDIESGNIVSKSGEDYLTICYERLGAVFVEAIKELRQENKKLKDEIVNIKKDLENCKRIIYIQ